MRLFSVALLLVALATLPGLRPAQAQVERPAVGLPEPPARLWLEGGLGYGGAGAGPETEAGGALAGRLAACVLTNHVLLIARTTLTSSGPSPYRTFELIGSGTLRDVFQEAALLAGYTLPLDAHREATGAAGLALVWGSRAASNRCSGICFATGERVPFALQPGIPVEIGVSVRLRETLRLGLLGYGNANREEVFGGPVLSGSVGLR